MCIVILTTSHPHYSLILLSNRDEFITRPTQVADWWSAPQDAVATSDERSPRILAGRDLHHPSHGTWLGLSHDGRIAVLTNFREETYTAGEGTHVGERVEVKARSRGEIPKAYLMSELQPGEWAEWFINEQRRGAWGDMGGFSLWFGELGAIQAGDGKGEEEAARGVDVKLGILSNRTEASDGVIWLDASQGSKISSADNAHGFTCSLSNSHFGDRAWPKVVKGEELLAGLTRDGGRDDVDALLARGLEILSTDAMPAKQAGEGWAAYARNLRKSIFVPPIDTGMTEGRYGTQKQTVVLVDRVGRVTFVERTLFDERGVEVEVGKGDRRYEWNISESYVLLDGGV